MSIPKNVVLAGVKFTVGVADLAEYAALGISYARTHKIVLDHDLSADESESVLLHEILHMLIHINLGAEFLPSDKEEVLVTMLETHLHKLYQRRKTSK